MKVWIALGAHDGAFAMRSDVSWRGDCGSGVEWAGERNCDFWKSADDRLRSMAMRILA
jgi:hypothetical protein